jgi:tryptophan halogenase
MSQPIRKVVIAGGGTAGWMTAAWFAKTLKSDVEEIILVESDDIPTVGVGEATTPYIQVYNQVLGIDEAAFLKFTGGTYKLGIEFEGWGRKDNRYFHPFGAFGRDFGALPFHSAWLRHALETPLDSLEAYNLQAVAARAGKFMPPAGANSPLAEITYAYHFDASLYARFLRQMSEAGGVTRIEGKIETVLTDDRGFITGLKLNGGRQVDGDLLIDCTGFRSLLLGEALGVGFEDWSHWLPCDRAYAVPTETTAPPPPFTRSIAHSAGWQWRIPLQHRNGNGIVFSSAFMDEATAVSHLMSSLSEPALAEPRRIAFTTGRRKKFWHNNCVAIGLSSGFLEPLESTSIMLIQNGIARLQCLFPDRAFETADIDAYNAEMTREYEEVRDFLILHYHVGQRYDSDFWRYCQSMVIPETLAARIALFESRGRISPERGEQFRTGNWLAVMWGQGLRPRQADPLALSIAHADLSRSLSDIRQVIAGCGDRMPPHDAFIQHYCRSTIGMKQETPNG